MNESEKISLLRELSARYGADVQLNEIPVYENQFNDYFLNGVNSAMNVHLRSRTKTIATIKIDADKLCYILADAKMFEALTVCRNQAVSESFNQTIMLYNLQK